MGRFQAHKCVVSGTLDLSKSVTADYVSKDEVQIMAIEALQT